MNITIYSTKFQLNIVSILTSVLIFTFTPQAQGQAQWRITAMQGEGGNQWVILRTLQEPGLQKQENVKVKYDPTRPYKSGTVFQTSNNSRIRLQYGEQMVDVEPNSLTRTMVHPKGASVQSFGGKLRAILKDVKSKLGFFKVGNGYVWAHAEGTTFDVTTNPNSKKATFTTRDNSVINVIDKANVNVQGRMGEALTVHRKVGSNSYYSSDNLPTIKFETDKDYRMYLLKRIQSHLKQNIESGDYYYKVEILASDLRILGWMFEKERNFEESINAYEHARTYYNMYEPNGVDYKYLTLCVARVMIRNDQVNEGQNIIKSLLPSLRDDLEYYYGACPYWKVLWNLALAYQALPGYEKLYQFYLDEAEKLPCKFR